MSEDRVVQLQAELDLLALRVWSCQRLLRKWKADPDRAAEAEALAEALSG